MKLLFYPFFSQQDKRDKLFLLGSDSGLRLYSYMASRALADGHDVSFVLPKREQCNYGDFKLPSKCNVIRVPYQMELNNLYRRLQWDVGFLKELAPQCDVFLTQHEFLSIPLRVVAPNHHIVMECGIKPDTAWPETAGLFPMAWKCADLVHCNSESLRFDVAAAGGRATVWAFGYDEAIADYAQLPRTISVVFPARASVTNYSNHEMFIEAFYTSALNVLMTDPTGYLRNTGGVPEDWLPRENLSRQQYLAALRQSKVVVGLTDNGYGGYAFIEAVVCGAVPVALRVPGYVELLGHDWPYYAEDKSSLRAKVTAALQYGYLGMKPDVLAAMRARLKLLSYDSAYANVRKDLRL